MLAEFIDFYRYCYSNVDFIKFCDIIGKKEDYFMVDKFDAFKNDFAKFIAGFPDWAQILWDHYQANKG
jgi:hypothetical protein